MEEHPMHYHTKMVPLSGRRAVGEGRRAVGGGRRAVGGGRRAVGDYIRSQWIPIRPL